MRGCAKCGSALGVGAPGPFVTILRIRKKLFNGHLTATTAGPNRSRGSNFPHRPGRPAAS